MEKLEEKEFIDSWKDKMKSLVIIIYINYVKNKIKITKWGD